MFYLHLFQFHHLYKSWWWPRKNRIFTVANWNYCEWNFLCEKWTKYRSVIDWSFVLNNNILQNVYLKWEGEREWEREKKISFYYSTKFKRMEIYFTFWIDIIYVLRLKMLSLASTWLEQFCVCFFFFSLVFIRRAHFTSILLTLISERSIFFEWIMAKIRQHHTDFSWILISFRNWSVKKSHWRVFFFLSWFSLSFNFVYSQLKFRLIVKECQWNEMKANIKFNESIKIYAYIYFFLNFYLLDSFVALLISCANTDKCNLIEFISVTEWISWFSKCMSLYKWNHLGCFIKVMWHSTVFAYL